MARGVGVHPHEHELGAVGGGHIEAVAMKEWRKRAKDAGVDVARWPTSLRPMVKAFLAEYRSAPGAVRSTAERS